jgi:hypothetical protein
MADRLWITLLICGTLSGCVYRNAIWTPDQIKTWTKENESFSTWKGLILYQGTDSTYHYFIARHMDSWVWMKADLNNLQLNEIHPHLKTSASPLGYYYLRPNQEFAKFKDY